MKKTKYKNWCVLLLLMIGLGSMILMFYYYKVREVANQERSYINIAASSEQIRDSSFFWGEHEIVQQIRPEENKITKFCIMFQRNMEVPAEGILHVELYDVQNDTVVQQWDLHESKIQGIDYQIFPLAQPLKNTAGGIYQIRVSASADCHAFPAVTNYKSYSYKAMVDGEQLLGTMVFNVQSDNAFLKPIYVVFSVILLLGVLCLGAVYILGIRRPEVYFLILGIFMGSMYIVLFPPNVAPDEHAHMAATYADVDKILMREVTDEKGKVYVRATDADITEKMQLTLDNMAYDYGQLFKVTDTTMVSYNRAPIAVPMIAHLPQTVGVLSGNLFHMNGMWTLYMGKITALLFYLLCIYFAIKILPWGKMIMAVIALFPMSLELAASYSYDCAVNALSFLFIAYTMYLIFEKNVVGWKDCLFLLVVGSWMAPCKVAYIFICGFAFAIPYRKFKNKKAALVFKVAFVSILLIATVGIRSTMIQGLLGSSDSSSTSEVGWTIGQILSAPVHSLGVLFNTYFEQMEYYVGTIVGKSLGWFQIEIPWHIIVGFILCLAYALYADAGKVMYLKKWQKALAIVLSVIMTGGIVLSMWLDFTPSYWGNVAGVQGRYFLPFLPMLLFTIKSKRTKYHENIENKIAIGMCTLQILTFFEVWLTILVQSE